MIVKSYTRGVEQVGQLRGIPLISMGHTWPTQAGLTRSGES